MSHLVFGAGKIGAQITCLLLSRGETVILVCPKDRFDQLQADFQNPKLYHIEDYSPFTLKSSFFIQVAYFCASVLRSELPPNATMDEITIANLEPLKDFIYLVEPLDVDEIRIITNPVDTFTALTHLALKGSKRVRGIGMALDIARYNYSHTGALIYNGVGFHGKPFMGFSGIGTLIATCADTAEVAAQGFQYVQKYQDNVVYSIALVAIEMARNASQYSSKLGVALAWPDFGLEPALLEMVEREKENIKNCLKFL